MPLSRLTGYPLCLSVATCWLVWQGGWGAGQSDGVRAQV
jgi:hypothetical protein